jgi:hypothetical protein
MTLLQKSLLYVGYYILYAVFVSFFTCYSNNDYFILRGKFSLMYITVLFLTFINFLQLLLTTSEGQVVIKPIEGQLKLN